MQVGYIVEIRHEALGGAPPKLEIVHVLAENPGAALQLVRTGMRLVDEFARVVGTLNEEQIRSLGLKPFQVKHA